MPLDSAPLVMTTVATPFGDVSIFASAADGVVRMSGFGAPERIASAHRHVIPGATWTHGENPVASAAIQAWLDGDAYALSAVPVEQPGGAFTQAAWRELRGVPGGDVVTYKELAEMAGSPLAMRAAGQACARNAVAPFVPCHRVVAADGIGNYGYGVGLKQSLLEHEGALLGARA